MLFRLFLCFTLIPVVELYLLIQVGTVIGGLNTVLLVILTGFAGAWLARMEGMNTMIRLRTNLAQGLMPAEELIDAVIIFAAGIVLSIVRRRLPQTSFARPRKRFGTGRVDQACNQPNRRRRTEEKRSDGHGQKKLQTADRRYRP